MSFDSNMPAEERKGLLTSYHGFDADGEYVGTYVPPRSSKRMTLISFLICVVCTIINFHVYQSAKKPAELRYVDLGKLRRPSQFIGIDRVQKTPPIPPPTLIFPNQIVMINQADPTHVYKEDPERVKKLNPLTAPEDRWFRINRDFSTLVEFVTIDYKMERCELSVTTGHLGNALHEHSNYNATFGPGKNIIDIWQVATPLPIDAGTMSYNTRPAREAKIDTIDIGYGTNFTYEWHCLPDTLYTFEFSAANDNTFVEWEQDHFSATPGVVMYQHNTFGM